MICKLIIQKSRHLVSIQRCNVSTTRIINSQNTFENPFSRTVRILGNDLKTLKGWITGKNVQHKYYDGFPSHCDVVIIGGGAMGSSIAYWLKERAGDGLSIAVVEKDFTYKEASTVLSVGGVRQQFSLPENIEMSLFAAKFLRNIKKELKVDIDIGYKPNGYLTLASKEGVDQLMENHKVQKELGANNILLSPYKLKERFPWLNTSNISLGCYGLENEGWFDPWALLYGLKTAAVNLGVDYIKGEAIDFEFQSMPDLMAPGIEPGSYEGLHKLTVKMSNGELKTIKFAICVIACGAQTAQVAQLARVGVGKGLLSIPIPIEPRKRYVYCIESKNGPTLNTPLTIDPSGAYFRREGFGGTYICGKSPEEDQEPCTDNLEVDYEYFENVVWPILAERVDAFKSVRVRSAWAGFYEYNYFDQNGIVGPHPYYTNLYICAGFSGHGIQHSPAIGRAVSEMIIDGNFRTIDLTRLGFDRIVVKKPVLEARIV